MLKKQFRLAKDADVKKVFARGRAFFNPLFAIKYFPGPISRFTVVVSTKVSKKAVVRNRIKRTLREVIRLNLTKFKPGDYAVVVKPGAGSVERPILREKFTLFCKSSKLANI